MITFFFRWLLKIQLSGVLTFQKAFILNNVETTSFSLSLPPFRGSCEKSLTPGEQMKVLKKVAEELLIIDN